MAAEQMQGRFAALDEEEFQTLLDNSEAENTKRSTVTAVKAFRDYLTEKLFSADFENYNKEELDQKLSTFYHEMRNKKGKLYKKSTLISYRTGLQRHLEKSGSDFDIIKGVAFKKSIKSFKLMTKELKRQGLANVEHFPVICDEDLEKIYDHLTSNLEDAQLLQYKVFIDIMLHFGVRGRKNLSSLTRSHFDVAQNSEGAMYVYSTLDEKTKNQQDNKERSPGRRMYEIKECQKCPVRSFVKYIRRLNPRCDRLFQQPRKQPKDGVYYDNVALGHNKLGTFMNQISVRCGLTTIYTNHSCHATTAHVLDSGQCLSRHMSVTVNKAESSRKTHCKKSDERTKELLSEKIAERIKKKCISHSNTWTGKKIVPEDFSSMSTRQENGDSPSTFQDDPSSYPTFVYNPGVLLHMTCENVEPESQSGNGKEVICNIKQEPMDTYFEGESENSQQSKELSLDSQTSQCTSMSSLCTADREIKVESDCQNHDQLSEGAWNSTHFNINSSIQVMGGNSDSVNTFSNTDVHSDNNIRNESQFSSDWKKNCLNDLKDTLKKTISGLEDLGAEVAAWVIIPNDNSSLIHHMGSKKGMEFILSKRNLDADLHLFLRNYGKQQSKRTEILQQPVQDLVNKETIYFPSHNQLLNNALLVSTKKDNPAGGPKGDNSENFCTRQSAIRGLKRKLSSTYSSCSNTDSQSTGEDSTEDSKDAMVELCTKLVAEKYALAMVKETAEFPYSLLKLRGKPWFSITGFPEDLLPFRHPSEYDVGSLKRIIQNQDKLCFHILHRKLNEAYGKKLPCSNKIKSALQSRLLQVNSSSQDMCTNAKTIEIEVWNALQNQKQDQSELTPSITEQSVNGSDSFNGPPDITSCTQRQQPTDDLHENVFNNKFLPQISHHITIKEEPIDHECGSSQEYLVYN